MKDLPDYAAFLAKSDTKIEFDGFGLCNVQDLYRVELELKDADEKYIPWTAIGRRDDVFAGAYPFCADLLPGVPHWVMQSLPSFKPRAALQKALSNAMRSYGGTLKAAHIAFGGDDAAALEVMRLVMAAEPSRRLLESGVFTVDHQSPVVQETAGRIGGADASTVDPLTH
jgi:hypothetical protein